MVQTQNRTTRIEARITPDALKIAKHVAKMEGRSLSDFVVTAIEAAVKKSVEDRRTILLSIEDQRAFAKAILNPPAPSASMRRAAKAYRERIQSSR